jgi:hypothetical protein
MGSVRPTWPKVALPPSRAVLWANRCTLGEPQSGHGRPTGRSPGRQAPSSGATSFTNALRRSQRNVTGAFSHGRSRLLSPRTRLRILYWPDPEDRSAASDSKANCGVQHRSDQPREGSTRGRLKTCRRAIRVVQCRRASDPRWHRQRDTRAPNSTSQAARRPEGAQSPGRLTIRCSRTSPCTPLNRTRTCGRPAPP